MSAQIELRPDEPGISIVQLNRPPANAYDLDLLRAFDAVIEELRADQQCKVVVIRGNEKFFSAGADIKWMSSGRSAAELVNFAQVGHDVLTKLERLPKIIIAAIEGHAMGGGLELALACDLRFMAAGKAQLAVPEVKISAVPNMGGTQRLPRLIGKSRALDLLITGRAVADEEAMRLGLVDKVMPAGDLMGGIRDYARSLISGATLAINLIKRVVNEGESQSLEVGLALERQAGDVVFRSQDFIEGVKAFAEKRAPRFSGK